ncbi:MAG: acyloxyacyl hydrolase, partial [Muribaculaceae bacterium]|nr:acyloxyacyl hydrolase [Muribaculaceae bacterium]
MKYNKNFLYIIALISATPLTVEADSIPSAFSRPLTWQTGAEISFGGVPGSCEYLRGDNPEHRPVNKRFSADLRAGFSFNPSTREGILYKGLYQGIGIGVNSYFSPALLGTPFSAYAYQGAPIAHITNKLWIGYEWQFGATFGWKHDNTPEPENHSVTSTAVTAHMGISFKFNYDITDRFKLSLGVGANHFSNGNTSWPNAGVNSIGAILGFTYLINPQKPEI